MLTLFLLLIQYTVIFYQLCYCLQVTCDRLQYIGAKFSILRVCPYVWARHMTRPSSTYICDWQVKTLSVRSNLNITLIFVLWDRCDGNIEFFGWLPPWILKFEISSTSFWCKLKPFFPKCKIYSWVLYWTQITEKVSPNFFEGLVVYNLWER